MSNIVNAYQLTEFAVADGVSSRYYLGTEVQDIQSVNITALYRDNVQLYDNIPSVVAGLYPQYVNNNLTCGRTTAGTYVDNNGIVQTALQNVARIGLGGLLVENASTNLNSYSNDFGNAYWTKGDLTISSVTAPNGTQNAQLLTEGVALASHATSRNGLPSVNIGDVVTQSLYVKENAGSAKRYIFLVLNGTAFSTSGGAIFNIATGVIAIRNPGVIVTTATYDNNYANGWVRVSITCIATATGTFGISARSANTFSTGLVNYTGDGISGLQVFGMQTELGALSSYIETAATSVTRAADLISISDYSLSSDGYVTYDIPPHVDASLLWQGSYTYDPARPVDTLAKRTLISQYANSPTIVQLVENMAEYLDPRADFDAFYNFVWNVDTAQGFGLDVWGRIVNIKRELQLAADPDYFGFNEALPGAFPFAEQPFFDGSVPATSTYILADDAYRQLILVKALSNITATNARSLNQLLQNLFGARGRCYVNDLGGMSIRYTFEFILTGYEIAVLTQSGAIPRPAGVNATIITTQVPVFGFSEAGLDSAAPFGQAPFISEGAIYATV